MHEFLVSEIGDVEGASVTDIGCGNGALLGRLSERGASRLVSVDASEGMLDVARDRAAGFATTGATIAHRFPSEILLKAYRPG
ncbi:MAG: class I SAM-dependent methyltransferase [Actinobacteria bacterium]|nr:class I SAM-dependent methyltransferase [Actinomycetota bacterium]